MDECRIYYGRSYSKMISDIVLTENDFMNIMKIIKRKN